MARPRNKETDEISKKLDCSKRHASRLEKQGVTPEDADETKAAKLRKTNAEIAKLEYQLEVLKGTYILKSEAWEFGAKLASILVNKYAEAKTNWPTQGAGKTAAGLRALMDSWFDSNIEEIREEVQRYSPS